MASPPIFRNSINPAFHRHPAEGAIIGRMVVSFGELEFIVAEIANEVVGDGVAVMRALYRIIATSSRIGTAKTLITERLISLGLKEDLEEAMLAIQWCLKVRNIYAHCHWADHPDKPGSGLFYADLQASAERPRGFDPYFLQVDETILNQQEDYFLYCLEQLRYLKYLFRLMSQKSRTPVWPKPPKLTQPNLHNSASQHVPPWLNEDQRARHIERALAADEERPTRTPAQLDLEARRGAKMAKKPNDRDRDVARRLRTQGDPGGST